MLDYVEYNIDGDGYQGNGYDKLDGDYALFYKVAKGFTHRVKPEDREDFLHDLILAMARVKAKYELIGKPLSEAGLKRVACYEVTDYWRKWFKQVNGVNCHGCGKRQQRKCHDEDLYRECPRAIKLESLDRVIEDGNGDSSPLHELIADDKAIDLVARLDARFTLDGYPRRFVQIAYKRYAGYPLVVGCQRLWLRKEPASVLCSLTILARDEYQCRVLMSRVLNERPTTAVTPESVPSSQTRVRELSPKAHQKGNNITRCC